MAQFALSSSHQRRVSENVAHGMFVLAPALTLNTLAATLLMGTGVNLMKLFKAVIYDFL
jgi:hypothetical protein